MNYGIVVFTRRWQDLFRVRYWVRCWFCSLKRGPYKTEVEARYHMEHECS